jgi:hypothetical protein
MGPKRQLMDMKKLMDHVDTYRLYVKSAPPEESIIAMAKGVNHSILVFLKDFTGDNKVYAEAHMGELSVIYNVMVGAFAKLYNKSIIDKIRSGSDALMRFFNIKSQHSFSYLPTKLFANFCKGITYFNGDVILEMPPYHRSDSCGTKALPFNEKFTINPADSPKTTVAKKQYLRKCYLERMIYNKIFENTLYRQDVQHMKELKLIERLYQDYHPDESINIDVSFERYIYPVNVDITTRIKSLKIAESFTKTFDDSNNYDANITVQKIVTNGSQRNQVQIYNKVQTYEKEMPYILTASI